MTMARSTPVGFYGEMSLKVVITYPVKLFLGLIRRKEEDRLRGYDARVWRWTDESVL